MKPRIVITMGDPAGVGSELILKALQKRKIRQKANYFIFGDSRHLDQVNRRILKKKKFPFQTIRFHKDSISKISNKKFNSPILIDFRNISSHPLRFGKPLLSYGKACGAYVEAAVRETKKGNFDAMVTAPINKQSFGKTHWGKRFVGHTEMLSGLTGKKKIALMMIKNQLRSVHVTSHIPLKNVNRYIKKKRIYDVIQLANEGLKSLGFTQPRIGVCGLNPHASDNGLMGKEESDQIRPAIDQARRAGVRAYGPFSADGLWPVVKAKQFDIGVAMYHDQGQIPVKMEGFRMKGKEKALFSGVNVTLGLPIIRTSVAHGTAYDIAGKGTASDKSLCDAIQLAIRMVKNRKKNG